MALAIFYQILTTEQFGNKKVDDKIIVDKKVLIATSAIDNGINLKDDKLKNIVIFSYDKTTFMQMLGRKRITNKKERVNLFIHNKTVAQINAKIQSLQKRMDAIDLYKKCKNNLFNFYDRYYNRTVEDFKIIHGLFYFKGTKCTFNPLGEYKLNKDIIYLLVS